MTDAHFIASSNNEFSRFLSRAKASDFPSIIKANETELSLAELSSDNPSFICLVMLEIEAFEN